jgi:hypothetical protein
MGLGMFEKPPKKGEQKCKALATPRSGKDGKEAAGNQ